MEKKRKEERDLLVRFATKGKLQFPGKEGRM